MSILNTDDLLSSLGRLVEICAKSSDLSGTLRQIATLCRESLGARACTIALIDAGERCLTHEACVGFDEEFEKRNVGRKIMLGSGEENAFLSYETVFRAVMVEAHDLVYDGNKYANPKTARRYGLRSMLSCPIESGQRLIGYVTVFSAELVEYGEHERTMLAVFANHTALALERFQTRASELRRNVVYAVYGGMEPPVDEPELNEMLTLIAEQCASMNGTSACLVHVWYEATQRLELKAHYPEDCGPSLGRLASLALDDGLIGQVARTQQPLRTLDLANDEYSIGKGLLCVPVRLYGQTVATVTVVGQDTRVYTVEDQRLLESVVASVPVAIERAAFQESFRERSPRVAESTSVEEFLRELTQLGREWLHEPVWLVWLLDTNRNGYVLTHVEAGDGVKFDDQDLFLDYESPPVRVLVDADQPAYVEDAELSQTHPLHEAALKHAWKSVLAAPIRFDGRAAGLIAVCSAGRRQFRPWHTKLFAGLAAQAGAALRNLTHARKHERLIHHAQVMQNAREENDLYVMAIAAGREILEASCGCFRKFSLKTGRLALSKAEPQTVEGFGLEFGEGVTGKAIQANRALRVDDVSTPAWRETYKALWPGQRSELAVPVVLESAEVRVGKQVSHAPKFLGVLNFESPTPAAFTEFDERCIEWLGRHAARILERIDLDRKLDRLRKVATEIASQRNWESIIGLVLKVITDTLGYEYVNISLVTLDRIKTAYLTGVEDREKFKRMADHPLNGNDIQADIVRNRTIEVVDGAADPRLDPEIATMFHHDQLLRVFVPMIVATDNRVIGTVEAGFHKSEHRKHVYERDVGVLEQFVEYATMALEKKSNRQLAMISHELNAPLVAVRNNASFLQQHIHELTADKIQRKCDDIMADAQVVQFQISQLEYALGHRPAAFETVPRKSNPVLFFRDIIIKTINQLKPLVRDFHLDPNRIEYDQNALAAGYVVNSDQGRLSQVVFNLFTNALKYADGALSFRIWIGAYETDTHLVVQFKDWGIGIDEDFRDKIFEDGSRSPVAIARGISGSGIGLTISKKSMTDLGGDLMLANARNPTEFHLLLPKPISRRRYDFVR